MINPQEWTAEAALKLQKTFGPRLLYLGLQVSYGRGEDTESSDIDLVTILDKISLDDLEAHRAVTSTLPEGEKTCGFICEASEFTSWPRHELFPFQMDTTDYHGKLADFMPKVERADIALGLKISASTLLHILRHTYLYGDPNTFPQLLPEARKSAFFIMRVAHYLKTGHYRNSKKALLEALEGRDQEILAPADKTEKQTFDLLINWCHELLLAKF
jgi:hypothetical protein